MAISLDHKHVIYLVKAVSCECFAEVLTFHLLAHSDSLVACCFTSLVAERHITIPVALKAAAEMLILDMENLVPNPSWTSLDQQLPLTQNYNTGLL